MRSQPTSGTISLLAALALVVSLVACDASADPRAESQAGSSSGAVPEKLVPSTPSAPPTASEKLGLAEGWGPERTELDSAAKNVAKLSLPELAGQVIVADWQGTAAPVQTVRNLHLGGVIAFSSNVTSADQITQVNRALNRQTRRRWPLFLGVDQEGGVVERLRGVATRFPAFMSAGAARDPALTRGVYSAAAAEMRRLGFTVDFAPDADVTTGPGDPTIGSRAASSQPKLVAEQVVAAAVGFQDAGVLPVIKHFPGHGSLPSDSHLGLPVQNRSLDQLRSKDLLPFQAAIEAGLPAIMMGHIDLRAVDPRTPSSLSRKVIHGLLRKQLGFGGLIVTDSLQMAGVTRGRTPQRIAVQAIRAGADVLLMPASPALARAALVRAVRRGALPRRRLEQAAARQIALLRRLAKVDREGTPPAAAASRELSAAAVTVTNGPCAGDLVGSTVHAYGDAAAVGSFASAAAASGITVLTRRAAPSSLAAGKPRPERRKREKRKAFRKRQRAWERGEERRERRLARWTRREDQRLAQGTQVAFVGYRDAPLDGDVVVATDSPWVLGRVDAASRIATYGDTPAAMDALMQVLTGKAKAPGRLPVKVAGVARTGC